ncbi:MAG: hypothetical protein AB8F94_28435 [Saprospiraceae bacterium]
MIKKLKQSKRLIYFLLGLFFFTYVFARSILVGITFDEAWTIGAFVRGSFFNIFACEPTIANNHLLNSFFIKLIYSTGQETIFLARLPNLIAMVAYLFFSYKICNTFFRPLLGLSLYVLLISNPLLLDFFGLARGYGLAMGFLMAALFFLLKFRDTGLRKDGIISLLLGSFAVLSNFTFLFFWMGLFITNQFIFFTKKDFVWKKSKLDYFRFLGFNSLITIVLCGIIYTPIIKLRAAGGFWYGGTEGFYQDTLVSLVSYSTGNLISIEGIILILNLFLFLFFVALLFFIFKKDKTKFAFRNPVIVLLFLIVIPFCLNIFLHHFLETKFLINRTALFYFPLFMFGFAFLIRENNWKSTMIFMRGSIVLFSVLALFNFYKTSNLYCTINWPFDSRTAEVLNYINEKGKEQNKVFILDSTVMFSSALKYYQWKGKYKNVVYAKNQPDNLDESLADYFLYYEKSLADVDYDPTQEEVNLYPRDKVLYFEKEGIALLSNLRK